MNFNWESFEEAERDCSSKFSAMRQKIDRAFQTKFDENWITSNWLQTLQNEKSNTRRKTKATLNNPLIPLQTSSYVDYLSLMSNTFGSIDQAIQIPIEKEITAMDILEQMEDEQRVEFDILRDPGVQNQNVFEGNWEQYASEPSYSFSPCILNMLLSASFGKGELSYGYSLVTSVDPVYIPSLIEGNTDHPETLNILENLEVD
jgi:hypothetical protein